MVVETGSSDLRGGHHGDLIQGDTCSIFLQTQIGEHPAKQETLSSFSSKPHFPKNPSFHLSSSSSPLYPHQKLGFFGFSGWTNSQPNIFIIIKIHQSSSSPIVQRKPLLLLSIQFFHATLFLSWFDLFLS